VWTFPIQTTQTASGLCAGNYTVNITDANGCTAQQIITITQPAPFVASANATNSTFCPGGCTDLNASATGGIAPYTYSWAPGGMTTDTVNVCPTSTTTYTCFATDSGGCCISNVQVTVTMSGLTVTTNATNSNCSSNTGTATAIGTGGTSPYTYLWSIGQTTQTATGLAPGTYSVIVTDANGCTGTQTVTIGLPPAITVNVTTIPSACSTATGTATAIASNGTGPYNYSWSNGQTWPISTGMSAGFYFVIVTDANGCTTTQTFNIGNVSGPTATASATALATGSQLNATGGGTYLWSPSSGLSCTTCANPIANPGQTTTYCVLVTDANGCTDLACVTVTVDQCATIQLSTLLPNAFSPNGDALNDVFCVPINNCIKTFLLKVYDRWGEKVFESDNVNKCWDGIYNGQALNTDVFAFYFDAVLTDGASFSQKGNISLVR
jgi:gliding motility-associated-like protein